MVEYDLEERAALYRLDPVPVQHCNETPDTEKYECGDDVRGKFAWIVGNIVHYKTRQVDDNACQHPGIKARPTLYDKFADEVAGNKADEERNKETQALQTYLCKSIV